MLLTEVIEWSMHSFQLIVNKKSGVMNWWMGLGGNNAGVSNIRLRIPSEWEALVVVSSIFLKTHTGRNNPS